jgi:hypothetical protein
LYATKSIYPRALEFATFFFCVLNGPIRLSQRLQLFVSFAKFSSFVSGISERTTVAFHIRLDRTEPRGTEGLTGPEAVTNILSEINNPRL